MSTLTQKLTLAEIVNANPSLARQLEARGLDYCCGGASTLEDACARNGLEVTRDVQICDDCTIEFLTWV